MKGPYLFELGNVVIMPYLVYGQGKKLFRKSFGFLPFDPDLLVSTSINNAEQPFSVVEESAANEARIFGLAISIQDIVS